MLFKSLVSKLKIASATVLGGIKVGANLSIEEDGTLNAASPVSEPVAENDFLVASGSPLEWDVKTVEETKTILGIDDLSHNSLSGLDGGNASPEEYYHLNAADYNALTDTNAQLTALQTDGSPTFAFPKSKLGEVYKTSNADSPLTALQCKRTIVSNYGMKDADCAITLPTAEEGLAFLCILPTVRARYFRLTAAAKDKIYLSGVAGSDAGYVGVASGYATGTACQMFTFKASDGGFDWFCLPIFGTWVAG